MSLNFTYGHCFTWICPHWMYNDGKSSSAFLSGFWISFWFSPYSPLCSLLKENPPLSVFEGSCSAVLCKSSHWPQVLGLVTALQKSPFGDTRAFTCLQSSQSRTAPACAGAREQAITFIIRVPLSGTFYLPSALHEACFAVETGTFLCQTQLETWLLFPFPELSSGYTIP